MVIEDLIFCELYNNAYFEHVKFSNKMDLNEYREVHT